MSPELADDLRLGCVPYLNARPLIYNIEANCTLEHPSVLARMLFSGKLDAALVPVAEWFSHPQFLAIDSIGIACDGPVYSVILAGTDQPRPLETVFLDDASRTSAMLTRILFHQTPPKKWQPISPALVADWKPAHDQAVLLIGSQAIQFRMQNPQETICDLGSAWKSATTLPFLFAVWLIRPDYPQPDKLARDLRRIANAGLAWRARLAEDSFDFKYLNHYIQFRVSDNEKRALHEFRQRAADCSLLDSSLLSTQLNWV